MPKRELQFVEGKSEKFWHITLKGKTHTVTYGRINTAGRTLSKTFDSPAEAKASYTRLIESKLKKGYRDGSSKKKQAAKKKAVKKRVVKKKSTKKAAETKPVRKAAGTRSPGKKSVKLNDLSRRLNMFQCKFRDKRGMADQCKFVWFRVLEHLLITEPWIDTVIWEIGPTVSVRPACTALDESHRSFNRPQPVYFEVKGYKQELKKVEKQKGVDPETIEEQLQALEDELVTRMQEAIIKSFQNNLVKKMYDQYNPDDRPFSILTTTEDQGLHVGAFDVIWKNRRGTSAAQIRRKQASVKGTKPAIEVLEESICTRRIKDVNEKRKKEVAASKKYWQAKREKAEQKKPATNKKLAASIEQAEARIAKLKKKAKAEPTKGLILSLDDGNQYDRKLAPDVKLDRLAEIVSLHTWDNFSEYDNRLWEYTQAFIDPFHKQFYTNQRTTWKKLNRAQKTLLVLATFIGQVDNGGAWQFLFNNPEYALAALEALHEIGDKKLSRDYQAVLEEFVGKADTLSGLRKRFADKKLSTRKQWEAFAEGYEQLKSAEKIQKYFYTVTFKKGFFKKIADYIEASYPLFASIKS